MSKVNFRELESIENQEDIRSFSKEYLSEVYNAIYKDYKIGFKGIPRELENINDYFLFCNKDLDIHLIYIRKANGQIILTNPIFTKSDRTVGRVIIHDLTDNIDYNLENKYYYTEKFLNYILSKEYIALEVTNIVGNYLKILGGFNLSLIGEKMFEKDFELNLEPDLKLEDKSYVYKVSKLNKIIYNYDEIIRLIDNNQLSLVSV